MLKAYMVFDGSDPGWETCFLVFAGSRNRARYHIIRECWDGFEGYTNLSAIRRPAFDEHAVGDKPYTVETNDDLPPGVKFYFELEP